MKLKMVINIFGGPGVGKSTVAAELFTKMKKANYNVELVTEYAKELTYEGRYNILEQDQLYIFAKQHRRILRIKDQVNFIITDSPLLLSAVYASLNPHNIYSSYIFEKLVVNTIDKYNNFNVYLKRNPNYEYKEEGRYQNEAEAKNVDKVMEESINEFCKSCLKIQSDDKTTLKIMSRVRRLVKK